eukprot:TRINITY_DN7474_c0_g1_i3.p1 TRINITY_DN7474_c0_g1~~TRINITY_DN7474_c0_g1_i3.p1  ORF type:complete len:481 (+),score=139.55 TRINITY_DN7474_c0_g1_i3:91-1533(+)
MPDSLPSDATEAEMLPLPTHTSDASKNEGADPSDSSKDTTASKSNEVAVTIADKQLKEEEGYVRPSGVRFALLFLGLCLTIFLAALDQSIVSTAVPKITSDFGSIAQIPWVTTAYLLTVTAFQPIYGRMSDTFGRKPTLMFAIVIFEFGSLMCAVAQDITWLIVCRAVAGVGGAGLMSMVFIVISDIVTLQERGKYQGIIGASFTIASIVGPLMGGAFTDKLTWRWCFYINLPFGAVALLFVALFLKVPVPKSNVKEKLKQVDYFGATTLLAAVVALLLALNWGGNDYAWDSPVVIALFVVAGVLAIAFVLIEIFVAKFPIIWMGQFKIRNVAISYAAGFTLGFCMFGALSYLPVYFQVVQNDSATDSGLRLLAIIIPNVIFMIGSGVVVSKTGWITPMPVVGLAILCMGMGILSLLDMHSSFGQMVGILIPTGVGMGLCLQACKDINETKSTPRSSFFFSFSFFFLLPAFPPYGAKLCS